MVRRAQLHQAHACDKVDLLALNETVTITVNVANELSTFVTVEEAALLIVTSLGQVDLKFVTQEDGFVAIVDPKGTA